MRVQFAEPLPMLRPTARVRPTAGPGRMDQAVTLSSLSTKLTWTDGQETYLLQVSDCLSCLVFLQTSKQTTHPSSKTSKTHSAVWAGKATHVLYDPYHLQPRLPAEGQLPPHIPNRHCLWARVRRGLVRQGQPKIK